MKQNISDIFNDFKNENLLIEMIGEDAEILRIAPVDRSAPGDLVFVDNIKYIDSVKKNKPAAAVVSSELSEKFQNLPLTLLITSNVSLAHALIRQKYSDRDLFKTEWDSRHPSAVIHESASIPESCILGPNAVIGRDVQMGENCVIMANSTIESGASIGEGTVIHPGVIVGYNSVIGKNVIIKSGSVIGSEGFGFAQDQNRRSYRIPQTGRVVIEDDVVIGANNCIDRATYNETRIGRGTKLDNLCHVAHNVQIGEDCLLTAGFVVAGSTKIGNRVIASGQTGILDHLSIADDCIFVHRAGVTENIEKADIYAGLPVLPLKTYMKNIAIFRKIDNIRKSILNLEKKFSE